MNLVEEREAAIHPCGNAKEQCMGCIKATHEAYMSFMCSEWRCAVEYDEVCDKFKKRSLK